MVSDNNNFILYNEVYTLYLDLYPLLKKFPNSEKFILRQNIENTLFEIIIELDRFMVLQKKENSSCLKKANYLFDKFKLLIRISKDLHIISQGQYLQITEKSQNIGKLLGGVIKKYSN